MRRELAAYLAISAAILIYVGACSRFWDEVVGSDAWEHHRAVVAMAERPWRPGNPTFATEEPSIRYSPYTLAMAAAARYGGIDPFDALAAAAVFNTALMLVGLYALMRAFDESAAAAAALIVAVTAWGVAPGYANSYALADLPWHQLNPSAFAMGIALITWAAFAGRPRGGPIATIGWGVALGAACLSHPMTGLFGLGGLAILAMTTAGGDRGSPRGPAAAIAVAAAVCLAWPWYSFWEAARSRRDVDYWFNGSILFTMYSVWCVPAFIMVTAALPYHRERLVRFCLAGAGGFLALGAAAFALRSPTLARMPIPAMIFLQIPIGLFVHRSGLLRPATWPGRIRAAWSGGAPGLAGLEIVMALILGYCLVPQLWAIMSKPQLARAYVARLVNRDPKLLHTKAEYDELLRGVGRRDVVLGPPGVSWPVPSSRGRIVSALHYEFFTPDQPARDRAVETFFTSRDPAKRAEVLDRYDVRWLITDVSGPGEFDVSEFVDSKAVVASTRRLRLLDADVWRAEQGLPPKSAAAEAGADQGSSMVMSGPRVARPPGLRARGRSDSRSSR